MLASTRRFFAHTPVESQRIPSGVYHGDHVNVIEAPVTISVTTATSTPTSPTMVDSTQRGAESPRISLPERNISHSTATATCRPRTWMQQLMEGQISEPRRERDSSNESLETLEEIIPGDVPDEL